MYRALRHLDWLYSGIHGYAPSQHRKLPVDDACNHIITYGSRVTKCRLLENLAPHHLSFTDIYIYIYISIYIYTVWIENSSEFHRFKRYHARYRPNRSSPTRRTWSSILPQPPGQDRECAIDLARQRAIRPEARPSFAPERKQGAPVHHQITTLLRHWRMLAHSMNFIKGIYHLYLPERRGLNVTTPWWILPIHLGQVQQWSAHA